MIRTITAYIRSGTLKNLFIYSFGALFLKGISFFLLPLYTSLLTPEEFGKLELLSTFASVLEFMCGLGLAQYFFMEFYRYDRDQRLAILRKVLRLYSTLVLALHLLVVLICFFFQGLVFQDIQFWVVIMVITTTYLTFFQTIYILILKLELKGLEVTLVQVVFGVIAILLNVLLIVYFRTGYPGIVLAGLIAMSLGAAYAIVKLHRYASGGIVGWPGNDSLRILPFSLPFIPSMMSVWLMNSANRWILLHYVGMTELGYYSVAAKFSTLLDPLLLQPFLNVYAPRVLQRFSNGDYRQPLGKNSLLLVPATVLLAIILVFIARFMVDERYYPALQLIPMMISGYYFSLLAQMAGNLLVFRKRVKRLLLAILAGATISVGGNLLLVRFFGVAGCALGTAAGNAAWLAAILYFVYQERLLIRREGISV